MGDFRKLGANRNAVAINKAVSTGGSSPITISTVGDVTSGEVVTVDWSFYAPATASTTATAKVGSRATVALLAGMSVTGRYLVDWSISGGVLSATLNANGAVEDSATFWVF